MTTDLALRNDPTNLGESIVVFGNLAGQIAKTEFVPQAMRNKPEVVLACLLYGRELGLGPMQSLASVNVIQGKPSLSAEGMRSLVLGAGHALWIEDQSDTSVTLCGRRAGDENVTRVTWNMEDAKRAKLSGDNWTKYPRAMLLARATSEICRAVFPDVIAGLSYVPEEIESFTPAPPARPARSDAVDADAVPVASRPAESGEPFPAKAAAPANVDPATGEITKPAPRKRREPPGAPVKVTELIEQLPPPTDPAPPVEDAATLATGDERAPIVALLAGLSEDYPAWKATAQQRWTAAGLPPFAAAERFTSAHASLGAAILGAVLDEAAAAEAPFPS